MSFDAIKIGLASRRKSGSGPMARLKPETINYRTLKPEKTVCSVKESSDQAKTGSAIAVNIRKFATKA